MKPEPFYPSLLVIPFQLIKDKKLEQVDRMLYGVIYWYEHLKDGKCYASNAKIAEILGTTPRVVQNSLTSLEDRGYIQRVYKDVAKRNRLEIRGLIDFGKVSPTGDRQPASDPQVTDVSPIGDRASDPQVTRVRIRNKNNKEDTSGASSARVDEVAEIIHEFEAINPAVKKMYGNKTQREACKSLIQEYGFTETVRVIREVLPKTNAMAFFPTLTTPLQLEEGWTKLKSAVAKFKGKSEIKKKKVAFA